MAKTSAGLVVWRRRESLEVLLVHPGGPFFARRHEGVWSIPKGEYDEGENALEAARREFREETGWLPPESGYRPLGEIRQRSGKVVTAWAVEGDFDAETLRSNLTEMGWPECDRAGWFPVAEAVRLVTPGQDELLRRLESDVEVANL